MTFEQIVTKYIKDFLNYEKYRESVEESRDILYESFFEEIGITSIEEKIGALRFLKGKLEDGTVTKEELRKAGENFIQTATTPKRRTRKPRTTNE